MKDAAPKSQQVQTTIATAYREFGSALATPAHVCKDTVMLLQLTTKSKHRAKAIAALNAWVIDRTDGPAAVARAQQACVGFIKSTGTKIIRKRTLPAAFTNPTPTELTTLQKLCNMPVKPSLDTAPATEPNQPDRDPWLAFDIQTAAVVSAGQGPFVQCLQAQGIEVKWCTSATRDAQQVEQSPSNPQAFASLAAVDPLTAPAVDLLVAGEAAQPMCLAGLRSGWSDDRAEEFFPLMRLAAAMQPKAVLIQTKAAIKNAVHGQIWKFIKRLAAAIG